jgi:hypothetical protein
MLRGYTFTSFRFQVSIFNRWVGDLRCFIDGPFKMNPRCFLLLFLSVSLTTPAFAEKFPLTIAKLRSEADVIVVASVEHIRVESEPSQIERGFGNSDWGIYLTFKVEMVEKGDVLDEQLEARCFRIKSRKSSMEFLTPSGHHPIPGPGTRVRAYLEKENGLWRVVLPNGITSVESSNELPDSNLLDATKVTQLRSPAFTYIFPLEIWVVVVPVIILGILLCWFLSRRYRNRMASATEIN